MEDSKSTDKLSVHISKNPWFDALWGIPAKVLVDPRHKEVRTLPDSMNVMNAMKKLSEYKFLSAPVTDEEGNYIDFIDMQDLLFVVAKRLPRKSNLSNTEINVLSSKATVGSESLKKVLQSSGNHSIAKFTADTPCSAVAQFLNGGSHRCLLTETVDSVEQSYVVTRTDILRILESRYDSHHLLATMGQMTLAQLNIGSRVRHFPPTTTTLKAIRILTQEGLSCAALTDPLSDELVGNISVTDFHNVTSLSFLSDSCADFLRMQSPLSLKPVLVSPSDSLISTIRMMLSNDIHHVFIYDSNNNLMSITIGDILDIICEYVEGKSEWATYPEICSTSMMTYKGKKSVQDTLDSLKNLLEIHHFDYVQEMDFSQSLKHSGVEIGHDIRVLEVCNTEVAQRIMKREVRCACFVPTRITIFEYKTNKDTDEYITVVQAVRPSIVETMLGSEISKEASNIEKMLNIVLCSALH